MNTENLSTLKIHKLSQAQYDREIAAGRIDENALYLTPDDTSNHNHSGASIAPASIELTPSSGANHGGFIDFHYNGSSSDKTSRIWEQQQGVITFESSGGIRLATGGFGDTLPTAGIAGRIFFKRVGN